jgi:adenylate cyclase
VQADITGLRERCRALLIANRWPVLAVAASVLLASVAGGRLDTWTGDRLMAGTGYWAEPAPQVVIVAINEGALAGLPYRSPIDRAFLKQVIEQIDAANPRAIGLDVLIDQPTEPAKDNAFRATLEAARAPFVIAYANRDDGLTKAQADHLAQATSGIRRGHVTLERSSDGAIRYWPQPAPPEARTVPLFSVALARAAAPETRAGHGRIIIYDGANADTPPVPVFPAGQIGLLPKAWLRDRIVLIGATLPNIDEHRTYLAAGRGAEAGTLFGVAVHAHMITQLLRKDHMTQTGIVLDLLLAVITAVLAAALITRAGLPLTHRLIAVAGLIATVAAFGLALFYGANIETGLVTIMLAGGLAAAMLATRQWFLDFSERQTVKRAFAQYVNPRVIDRILADPTRLQLGGEQRSITCIFTDIAGFTALSEQLSPREISSLLNSYLDGVCELFVDHGATIDKIVGDGVIGFFGAPDDQPDQAARAVRLALAIDRYAQAFRNRQASEGVALGETRQGVHRGPAIVGNFGGTRFFDYTGIGDTVNTAARMEAANKVFGTRICVSATVADAYPAALYRPIGDIILSGRKAPLLCLEPLSEESPAYRERKAYRRAYQLMEDGDDAALAAFAKLAGRTPDDPLVNYHLGRLRAGEMGTKIRLTHK